MVVEIIAAVVLMLYNKHIELLDIEVNRLLKQEKNNRPDILDGMVYSVTVIHNMSSLRMDICGVICCLMNYIRRNTTLMVGSKMRSQVCILH